MFKFQFGDEIKDSVTGVGGIVTGMVSYITGCKRYAVEFAVNRELKSEWIDESRAILVKAAKAPEKPKKVGGPASNPPRG